MQPHNCVHNAKLTLALDCKRFCCWWLWWITSWSARTPFCACGARTSLFELIIQDVWLHSDWDQPFQWQKSGWTRFANSILCLIRSDSPFRSPASAPGNGCIQFLRWLFVVFQNCKDCWVVCKRHCFIAFCLCWIDGVKNSSVPIALPCGTPRFSHLVYFSSSVWGLHAKLNSAQVVICSSRLAQVQTPSMLHDGDQIWFALSSDFHASSAINALKCTWSASLAEHRS